MKTTDYLLPTVKKTWLWWVKEIAIFSINDCHRGEIPVAAVVWENEADDEGLISFAHENLSRYKVPRKIFALDELPRVNGWKLLRRELRKMFKI